MLVFDIDLDDQEHFVVRTQNRNNRPYGIRHSSRGCPGSLYNSVYSNFDCFDQSVCHFELVFRRGIIYLTGEMSKETDLKAPGGHALSYDFDRALTRFGDVARSGYCGNS